MMTYIIGWITHLFGWQGRVREAYSRGYDRMSGKLHAAYCGPDIGYDPALVLAAYHEIRCAFKGSKGEHASYEEGIRDAITAYEREYGAP